VPLEQTGNWPEWVLTVSFLGEVLAWHGEYTAGLAEGQRALARARETHYLTGTAIAHIVLGVIHLAGGEILPMLEATRAGVAAAEQAQDRVATYVGYAYRAWAESRLGQHADAVESMAAAMALRQSLGGHLYLVDWFTAANAEIALNAGHIQEAIALATEAVALAESIGGFFSAGVAHRAWARALAAEVPPRWEEAEAHITASLRAFASGDCRVEVARTHLAWGQICSDRQDAAAALDHFEKAAAQCEAVGLARELVAVRRGLAGLN
jgi:tetratricopeptide (TPR) repeat protein